VDLEALRRTIAQLQLLERQLARQQGSSSADAIRVQALIEASVVQLRAGQTGSRRTS
jgi:hypothetical protein